MEILFLIIGLITGLSIPIVFYLVKKAQVDKAIFDAHKQAQTIIAESKKEAEVERKEIILEAKEEWYKVQKRQEDQINDRQKELRDQEKRYNKQLVNLDKRLESLDKKEQSISDQQERNRQQEKVLENKNKKLDALIEEQETKLQQIACLSKDEAVQIMRNELIETARISSVSDIRNIIEESKQTANREAAKIISSAIQRLSVDYVAESTVAVVALPGDDMKGRIIGREGRNIRVFEKLSGVDVIIDDTPESVVLSCFDPVRREIARIALEKLILDGRIHPGRIEEVIEKTKQEMDDNMIAIGEQACLEVNIHNISPNLIKLIGRLQYRTSYGQNILKHSIEAAWICGTMAAELGLDQEIARRAAFLHDIGKAIDHEFDGSHAVLGANLARKNGESKLIVNAIEAHHEEVEPESVYAVLTQAADAVSGARPGARREMIETYMQRLEKMEEICNRVEGVSKSYAIRAGREVRIIVDPTLIEDEKTVFIANDIASQIEEEMQYPGQIKVTVIRETRRSSTAK
ncbi:MAG: ribonuclease Y [Candidatus Cloacimonadota bacterium]|nr:MAG: ribonuclease Y [Candidatus Cloacimonadota bacterium]